MLSRSVFVFCVFITTISCQKPAEIGSLEPRTSWHHSDICFMGGRRNKRRRQDSSVSASYIMSSTPTNNMTYNALRNANETLYGPVPFIPNVSPPNMNIQPQLGPQMQTSTPIHTNYSHLNAPQVFLSDQGQGQFNTQTVVRQQQSGPSIELILSDIQVRLNKLNMLDSINDRLRNIEDRFDSVEKEIDQLKKSVTEHDKYMESKDFEFRDFHDRIQDLEFARDELENATRDMHETILDQQTRAMKYNLIFENIPVNAPNPEVKEETENVLKQFLTKELEVNDIQFHNVHRLKPRRDGKPPSIVAKFVYNKDKDTVINAARTKLVDKQYKVYQQYPQEISDRRRELVPRMKELRDQNQRAYIVKDKLFVNGRPYVHDARGQGGARNPGDRRNDPRNQVQFS